MAERMAIIANDREWKHYKSTKKDPDETSRTSHRSVMSNKTSARIVNSPPPKDTPPPISVGKSSNEQIKGPSIVPLKGPPFPSATYRRTSPMNMQTTLVPSPTTAKVQSPMHAKESPKLAKGRTPSIMSGQSSNTFLVPGSKAQSPTLSRVQSSIPTKLHQNSATIKVPSPPGSNVQNVGAATGRGPSMRLASHSNPLENPSQVSSPRGQGTRVVRKTKNVEIFMKK